MLCYNHHIFWLDGAGMKQSSSSSQGTLPGCGEVGFQSFCYLTVSTSWGCALTTKILTIRKSLILSGKKFFLHLRTLYFMYLVKTHTFPQQNKKLWFGILFYCRWMSWEKHPPKALSDILVNESYEEMTVPAAWAVGALGRKDWDAEDCQKIWSLIGRNSGYLTYRKYWNQMPVTRIKVQTLTQVYSCHACLRTRILSFMEYNILLQTVQRLLKKVLNKSHPKASRHFEWKDGWHSHSAACGGVSWKGKRCLPIYCPSEPQLPSGVRSEAVQQLCASSFAKTLGKMLQPLDLATYFPLKVR